MNETFSPYIMPAHGKSHGSACHDSDKQCRWRALSKTHQRSLLVMSLPDAGGQHPVSYRRASGHGAQVLLVAMLSRWRELRAGVA